MMQRRDLGKALMVSMGSAGTGLLSRQAYGESAANPPHYDRTPAEAAAGLAPVNYAYAPGIVDRYGTNTKPGSTDMTAAIQAALTADKFNNCSTGILFLQGIYRVTGTLTCHAGAKISGGGWASQAGSFAPVAGTVLRYDGTADVAVFSIQGHSTGDYTESLCIRDLAIHNAGASKGATGIRMLFAPFSSLQNVYVSSFRTGIEQGQNSWGCCFINVKVLDAARCLYAHNAGEDSCYISCGFRTYNKSGTGVALVNQSQTNLFLGCDISDNQYGVVMQQGDTKGNGTGTPYPMHATFINCQFEDNIACAINLVASAQSASNTLHPAVGIIDCRVYISGTFPGCAPNSGQAFIYAQHCSRIKVSGLTAQGCSYGAIINISQFGWTVAGSKPGPILWELDHTAVWGTARFHGVSGTTSVTPGDHAIARFTAAALAYTSESHAKVPFSKAVADGWSWYDSTLVAVRPTRNQTVRFKCHLYISDAPATRFSMSLYKNGTSFQVMYDSTLTAAGNPLLISGEAYDVPDGASDYYQIVIFAAADFTLDAAQSWFVSEVVGA